MAASFRQWMLSANILRSYIKTSSCVNAARSYAKKIVGKTGASAAQKTRMEVEKDPEKLLTYCCGANIFVEGSDPEIKPDSEYPAWLWNLRTERGGPDLSELDPDTKEYWTRLSRMTEVRNRQIRKRLLKLRQIHYPDDQT